MPPPPTLALGVVLLLPAEIDALARALGTRLRSAAAGGLVLDDDHLPHLTLVQLGVRETNLPRLLALVEGVVAGCAPIELRFPPAPGSTPQLAVSLSPALVDLHRALVATLAPLAEPAVGLEAFFAGGEPPRPIDARYVAGFLERASGERYRPHVSLGSGRLETETMELTALVDRIALCHLGRAASCRRVLAEYRLGERPGRPQPDR